MTVKNPPVNDSDVENPAALEEKGAKQEMKKYRKKFPGFRKNLYDYFQEYTDNTGIHGLKYIGDQGRTMWERIWWVILFCISLYVCIDLIVKTWLKWDRSPVLVSFATSPTSIMQVPFPALTICPNNKIKNTVYNHTDAVKRFYSMNLTAEELKRFLEINLVCPNPEYYGGPEKFVDLKTIDYLMSIAPQINESFYEYCTVNFEKKKCEELFTPIITEEGLCFTFNILDRKEIFREKVYLHGKYMSHGKMSEGWSLEGGYPKTAKIQTYPRRAISTEYLSGLGIMLPVNLQNLDYLCQDPVQGFKILLHHPAEIPRANMKFFRAGLSDDLLVSVKPDMTTTSEGLREYDPLRRQCYFSSERYLSFYKNYTQQNCQIECLTNYTLSKCGCVAYYMLHEKGTPICGTGSRMCMRKAQRELLMKELNSEIINKEAEEGKKTDECNCLPACISLTYNAELSEAKFEAEKYDEALGIPADGTVVTRLMVFFKDQQFIPLERNELYGQTDFIANCGGILGLFTGFSFLSIVEIVYFLSLRLICNVKHYGKHYWSGSSRLVNNPAFVHPKQ